MKKYTLIILTITLCTFVTQYVYAVPSDNIVEDLDKIPPEVLDYEVLDSGQATIKFVANYAGVTGLQDTTIFISGVKIELYYKKDGIMQNVYTLDEFQGLNLVSNENGDIILNNLPYGMYQYEITSVPVGMIINNNNVKFEVNPFDGSVNEINFLTIEQELSDNLEENKPNVEDNVVVDTPTVDKPIDNNVEVNIPVEVQSPSEEVVITQTTIQSPEQGEEEIINEEYAEVFNRFYIAARTDFQTDEVMSEGIIETPVTATIPKRIELSKKDAIEAMKEVRISDAIRVATIGLDPSVYRINQLANLPEDDRKNKKLNTLCRTNEKIMQKRVGFNVEYTAIKNNRINIMNKVA